MSKILWGKNHPQGIISQPWAATAADQAHAKVWITFLALLSCSPCRDKHDVGALKLATTLYLSLHLVERKEPCESSEERKQRQKGGEGLKQMKQWLFNSPLYVKGVEKWRHFQKWSYSNMNEKFISVLLCQSKSFFCVLCVRLWLSEACHHMKKV